MIQQIIVCLICMHQHPIIIEANDVYVFQNSQAWVWAWRHAYIEVGFELVGGVFMQKIKQIFK